MSTEGLFENAGFEEARVTFRRQPRPIPADARVGYKIAQTALVLHTFNKNAAALENLHLFSWALGTPRRRQMLLSWWSGNRYANTVTQRLDPYLPVALNIGVMRGVMRITTGTKSRIHLASTGVLLAQEIEQDHNLFAAEKNFLRQFGRLSDASVSRQLARS
ncbi:hypothetical protein [Streptomyces sp. ID01-9D]|uniref:hypothetical protein n=1 Tax=Streptomyces sp. ID01-9D TaxID=3028659 RepID=UPI0029C43AC8|nr:hypothetical protein [Streptomyces sp. ID01-9D]MDX5574348.1 hypothetical protein [Streptomyces sp. ID01-9D]